uniref:Uncharacterized protein n=1 Tax=viral metagenome TaxID=1070528 RepID=A0A6M3JCJ4_9ZZZZ
MGSSRVPEVLEMVGYAAYEAPDAIDAAAGGGIVSDVSLSTLSAGAMTVAAQPDYPRVLRAFLTDANASITSGTITIVGLDASGEAITDVLAITAAGVKDGVKAFAKVTSVTWALVTGTVTTTDDKIAIGQGKALGLPMVAGGIKPVLIKANFTNADDLASISQTYKTITIAGTLDAANSVEVWYRYQYLLKGHDLNA